MFSPIQRALDLDLDLDLNLFAHIKIVSLRIYSPIYGPTIELRYASWLSYPNITRLKDLNDV